MKILLLALGLLIQSFNLQAAAASELEEVPHGLTLVGKIRLDVPTDVEINFTAAKVSGGIPCFALVCSDENLTVYNFGLPEDAFIKIHKDNLSVMGSSGENTLTGVNILPSRFKSVLEIPAEEGREYHGRNWKISGEQVIVGADAGFDICTSFFEGISRLKLQACSPTLLSQFFSVSMQSFLPETYSAFPHGGCFFSGLIDFSVPLATGEGLKANMLVNGIPRFVIAAQQLDIEIKATPQPAAK